jgi:hypothetical protein
MKNVLRIFMVLCIGLAGTAAFAQDSLTTGSIAGDVIDSNGGAVPGASVKVTGALGERTTTTNDQGHYEVGNLIPGSYTVRIEKEGFKAGEVTEVIVLVGKATTAKVSLQAGNISEVVTVIGGGEGIDQASTATSSNLNDQLFSNIPVARAVSGLFYLAPGTTDSLGGGRDNPSISGGSALDNLYVADGVNITDSAFGGIGTFTRMYGPLGTGINTSFIKEVQVKTAGFEPQYGQSQGGIVNIVTQSGGNEYHGALYGFASPKSFEATRKQPDEPNRVNKGGKLLHEEAYDIGADFSGYIPGAKDKLFFFGSFNPTVRRAIVRGAERSAAEIAAGTGTNSGLRDLRGKEFANRTRTNNYAGKLEYLISPNHQVTFSIFGDPSKTNKQSLRSLVIDNTTADSVLDYGTRNMSLRYNGTLSPTLTLNASLGFGKSRFNETGFADLNNIADRRGSDTAQIFNLSGHNPDRGNFNAVGLGFFEPTVSRTRRADFNLAKTHSLWGQHTAGLGYTFQRGLYDGTRDRSGPRWTIPAGNGDASGQSANVTFRLRFRSSCADCPVMPVKLDNGTTIDVPVRLQVTRAEFGVPSFSTYSNYHAAYAQDTWRFNKYITGLFGLRWEQERLVGSPALSNNKRIGYTFTDQWAPRLGVTVDPLGHGKTKAFYNYGRFFEFIPLDLAERSLSAEQDWIGALFAPEFVTVGGVKRAVINQYGTVNPIIDSAHQLAGVPFISLSDPQNPITAGTKLGFTDEHTFGFEQQLPHNFTLSARYIKRDAKRIIEDAASVSPEASLAGIGQSFYIGNVSSKLDAAINLVPFVYSTGGAIPSGCAQSAGTPTFNFDGEGGKSVCFAQTGIDANGTEINTPDSKPDGFPDAVRQYRALEIELNRRFSDGWQGFFNWRIASLKGNFEGHLRNDNGQTDPAISSLFDFTTGDLNLLGNQFAIGPLNTDRKHIVNVFGSYTFRKERGWNTLNGLSLGLNVHMESGIPISEFLAHPVYLNAGEIPVGGRGKLGRTDAYTRFDVHTDYAVSVTETTKLKLIADFFNVFNSTKSRFPTQFKELDLAATNPDFLKPAAFYNPFNLRLGMRFEF